MKFWRMISPRRAVTDFVEEWRRPQPYRWQIFGVSVAATFALMMLLIPKSERAPPEKPDITYITTWQDGRSEAEIVASNIANQKRKEELQAEQAKRDAIRKEFYRELGRATGLDVDKMEREAKQDEAARAAARAREEQALEARREAAGQAPLPIQSAPGE